jgi:hypothetical protein
MRYDAVVLSFFGVMDVEFGSRQLKRFISEDF